MKISKLLNKKNFLFFIILIFFQNAIATEPVDIWDIDKTTLNTEKNNKNDSSVLQENSGENISIYDLRRQSRIRS